MKKFRIPEVSAESLENSLFESAIFDGNTRGERGDIHSPRLVRVGVICLCLRGGGTFVINDTAYEVSRGSLVTLLPNTLIQATNSSDDFLGYAIAASTEFMMNIHMANAMKNYLYVSSHPVLQITDEQMSSLMDIAEVLNRRREDVDHPFAKEISCNLLSVLCYEVYALYRTRIYRQSEVKGDYSRQSVICQEFLKLVEAHAYEHRDMAFYANELCLSAKYLSTVVRKASGHTTIEWIDRTVMRYARLLLTSSDMTVQQISAELNFPNPSFFGQYFKRHEGMTPRQFRSKNRS